MSRTKSSREWLHRHFEDPFVKRARKEGYRSRAVYKLAEVDKRDRLFAPGMTVVDLGAAPGGWSQYARRRVGPKGSVIALDILPIEPIVGVEVIQGDFSEDVVLDLLFECLGGRPVDLVMSDLAPNISGIAPSDQARSLYLAELATDFAVRVLRSRGSLLLKAFQGEGFIGVREALRRRFHRVATRKPKASRADSREVYLLARDYDVG